MSAVLPKRLRCAVYTRKSTEEGLDAEYTSIDAQRDAGAAYIATVSSHPLWSVTSKNWGFRRLTHTIWSVCNPSNARMRVPQGFRVPLT